MGGRDGHVCNGLAVLLSNAAVLLSGKKNSELSAQAVAVAGELLDADKLSAADALTMVVALGTLVHRNEEARSLLVDLDLCGKLEALGKKHGGKLQQTANQLVGEARAMSV